MKKFIAFLLLIGMLSTVTNGIIIPVVYADTEPVVSVENLEKDIINISGEANKGETVTIIVLNPGYSYDDYCGIDKAKRNMSLQSMGVTIANENGYSYSFPLRNFEGGEFTVYANGVQTKFEYYSKEQQSQYITMYNNDEVSFAEFISIMGLSNNVLYKAIGEAVAKQSVDKLKPINSNVNTAYNNIFDAFLIAAYNKHDKNVLFKNDLISFATELEIKDVSEYADYLELLSPNGIKQVEDALMKGKYNSKSDIADKFLDAVYVNLLLNYNQQGYGHISTIYGKYKSAYNKAGITFSSSDGNDLYRKIIGIKATTLSELKNEIDILKNGSSPNGGGGSSSSSSKSSSRGFANSGVESYINAEPTAKPTEQPAENNNDNTDLTKNHWAYTAMNKLMEKNIISGDENGNFRPDAGITRAEFAKMICVMFSIESGNATFSDVSANDWFSPYVCSLAKAGIIQGFEGKFNPNNKITRQDAAVIVSRVLNLVGDSECDFIDADEIKDYAKAAISGLCSKNIINGMPDKSFAPNQNLTRAQAASILAGITDDQISAAKDIKRGEADFLKAINAIEASEDSNAVVTRVELAKIYYRIILNTDYVPDYSDVPCKYGDVPNSLAAPINFVSDVGVMTDVGNGNFEPEAPLTYIQFLKSMVSFLGYSKQFPTSGGSDSDYIRVAMELGLVKKAPQNMSGYVTYLSADAVFRYAADVDIFAKTDNDTYKVITDTNYLKQYMNILQKQGIVTADNFFDVDNKKSDIFGRVKIDHDTYDVAETAKDLIYVGGKNVRYMYREEGSKYNPDTNLIVYYEEAENAEIVIDGDKIESIKNNQIRYYEGNRVRIKKFDSSTYIVYNGYALENYTDDMLNPFDEYDGCVTVVDNNNDNIADIINISAYNTMVVGDVRNNFVYSKIRKGQKINLDDMNGLILNVYGEQINSDDIKKNDILTYEVSPKGEITKINVSIDIGGGVIEAIEYNDNSDIDSIIVSGEKYFVAKTVKFDDDFDRFRVGENVTLYFNRDDKVCDFEIVERTDQGTGLVVKYVPCDDDIDRYQLKIFMPNGKFETIKLASKVTINNSRIDSDKALDYLGTSSSGFVKRQLITYLVNNDGEITKIGLAGSDGLYEISGFDGDTEQSFTENINTFGLKASVDNKSVIFVMPDEANRNNERLYSIKSSSIFDDGTAYKLYAYASKENSYYIEKAVYEDNKASTGEVETSKSVMVVDNVVSVYEDGDVMCKVTGAIHATDETVVGELYADDMKILCVRPDKSIVKKGDIIQYITDATGKITKANLILDKSGNQLVGSTNPTTPEFPSGSIRFAYGKVYSKTDSLITVELVDIDGTVRYETYPIYRFQTNGITYIYNKTGNGESTFSNTPYDYIYDKETYGDEATSVFVFWSGKWWITGILFVEND